MIVAPGQLHASLLYSPQHVWSIWDVSIHIGLVHWLIFVSALTMGRLMFALWVDDRRERRHRQRLR